MDELVSQVAAKTGLSPDKARTAVETVVNFIKGKIPAPLASQLDGLLAGGGGTSAAGDVVKGLGDMLGKK